MLYLCPYPTLKAASKTNKAGVTSFPIFAKKSLDFLMSFLSWQQRKRLEDTGRLSPLDVPVAVGTHASGLQQ